MLYELCGRSSMAEDDFRGGSGEVSPGFEPKNTDAVCNKLSCWLSHFVKFDLTLKILM